MLEGQRINKLSMQFIDAPHHYWVDQAVWKNLLSRFSWGAHEVILAHQTLLLPPS